MGETRIVIEKIEPKFKKGTKIGMIFYTIILIAALILLK